MIQVHAYSIVPGEPGAPYVYRTSTIRSLESRISMAELEHMCPSNKELSEKHESLLPGKGEVGVNKVFRWYFIRHGEKTSLDIQAQALFRSGSFKEFKENRGPAGAAKALYQVLALKLEVSFAGRGPP